MDILKLKLTELNVPEKNVRIHTEKQLQEYERSVRMFGQIRPIIIDEGNTILAGRGLYETLKRMGKDTAECYRYENLTENQKKKLMIADNRVYALGVDDLTSMNDILSELIGDLDVPGFDEEILKQMMADADEITATISEYGKLDEDEIAMLQAKPGRKEDTMPKNPVEKSNSEASNIAEEAPCESADEIPEYGMQASDSQAVKRYVKCPKCGERIWL